jgi:hypothetical protein
MKKLTFIIGLVLIVVVGFQEFNAVHKPTTTAPLSIGDFDTKLRSAFENRQSNIQVLGSGEIIKVLVDDNKGSRHQRFILRTDTGQTILVAHNIDLAQRINGLKVGDDVEFNGEYEWNAKGGVIHWTHRDPEGRHESGWLKHESRIYQ